MPWSNQGGGSGGGGGPWGKPPNQGPWGQGPSGGSTPPDLEEMLRRGQDKLRQVLPVGGFGGKGVALAVVLAIGADCLRRTRRMALRSSTCAGSAMTWC